MTQKLLSKILLLALCVLFISCRSMLNYTKSSSSVAVNDPKAVLSGYFISEKSYHEGDVLISGFLAHSAWSSLMPFASDRYTWKGTLSFSGMTQSLEIVTWLTNSDKPNRSLNPVSIRGLPVSFICNDFPVLSSRPSFSRIETYKRITEFDLNGNKLYVEFSPKYRFQGDNHFQMLQDKRQIVQIVDENGNIYADFDTNSYRIYEQPPDTPIEQLQMAVAVFSLVQHICMEWGPLFAL
jgi:hypothetical protein